MSIEEAEQVLQQALFEAQTQKSRTADLFPNVAAAFASIEFRIKRSMELRERAERGRVQH